MNRFLQSPDCTFDGSAVEIEISENEMDDALCSASKKHLALIEKNDALRIKLAARFRSEDAIPYAEKLESCNQPIVLRCSNCHHSVAGRTSCRRRFCPVCARVLAARRVAKYETRAKMMKWPLHVTLTQRNTESLSRDDLQGLLRAFKTLRRTALWSRSVAGGFVALEVTHKGRGWHHHLHILCDAEWLAYKTPPPMRWHSKERKAELYQQAGAELSALWAGIVGQDTASINVRRCAAEIAVREVLKYTVKGTDMLDFKGRAADVVAAMEKTRLFTPFGSMYGKEVNDDEPTKSPCACGACGEVGTMMPEEVMERLAKYDTRKAPSDRRVSR